MTDLTRPAIDGRYDILFEPVKIGPLTAKNRFFQVPHCNGMGYRDPSAEAAMRRVKAEGGWGVVCTEQVEIHPTSDITPFIELRIWDDQDIPALARIADAIHEGAPWRASSWRTTGPTRPISTAARRRSALGTSRSPRSTTTRSRLPLFRDGRQPGGGRRRRAGGPGQLGHGRDVHREQQRHADSRDKRERELADRRAGRADVD